MSHHFGPTETRLQAELRLFSFAQEDDMPTTDYTIAFKQLASSLDLPERCLRIFYLGNLNERAQSFLNRLQSIPEKMADLYALAPRIDNSFFGDTSSETRTVTFGFGPRNVVASATPSPPSSTRLKCKYCRKFGHKRENCPRLKARNQAKVVKPKSGPHGSHPKDPATRC